MTKPIQVMISCTQIAVTVTRNYSNQISVGLLTSERNTSRFSEWPQINMFILIYLLCAYNLKGLVNMTTQERIIANLQEQVNLGKQKIIQYRHLYIDQRKEAETQNQLLRNLRQSVADLQEINNNLTHQLELCSQHINDFKVPKGYKKWAELISPISRNKRKASYRKCLDQSMMHLHEAERVKVSIKIGQKELGLLWSKNDLKSLRRRRRLLLNNNPTQNRPEYDSDAGILVNCVLISMKPNMVT